MAVRQQILIGCCLEIGKTFPLGFACQISRDVQILVRNSLPCIRRLPEMDVLTSCADPIR